MEKADRYSRGTAYHEAGHAVANTTTGTSVLPTSESSPVRDAKECLVRARSSIAKLAQSAADLAKTPDLVDAASAELARRTASSSPNSAR